MPQSKLDKITHYLAIHEKKLGDSLDLLDQELKSDDIEIETLEELKENVTKLWDHYNTTQTSCQEEGGVETELFNDLQNCYFALKKATAKTLTKKRAKLAPPATP